MKVTDRWHSTRLGQDLAVARWGTFGVPVLLFPTAGGDAEEVERNGLVGHLQPLIDAERIKVYSCDSVAGQAMIARRGTPEQQLRLFNLFHEAVVREVVPAIHADSGGPLPIVVAGASIGAFNAFALICRHPELFEAAVCMSGTYAIERLIGGRFTDDLYFSSPLHFLPGLDGEPLEQLRHRRVILASGTGDWEDIGESWRAAEVLAAKGVPHRVDDWGPDSPHDWPTWWRMLPTYLDELVP